MSFPQLNFIYNSWLMGRGQGRRVMEINVWLSLPWNHLLWFKVKTSGKRGTLAHKHYKGKRQEIYRNNCSYHGDGFSYPFYIIMYAIVILPCAYIVHGGRLMSSILCRFLTGDHCCCELIGTIMKTWKVSILV